MRQLVRLSTVLFAVAFVLVMLAAIPDAVAQNPTPTLTPTVPPQPACQLYHLTVPDAAVRACAGLGCSVEGGVTDADTLCILGMSETPGWMLINLEPENPASSVSYISADVLAVGPVGFTQATAECEPWRITVPEAIVRQCAGFGCGVLGGLPADAQICVLEYGGVYQDWLYVDYSSHSDTLKGWVSVDVAERLPRGTVILSPSMTAVPQTAGQAAGVPASPTPSPTLPVCAPGTGITVLGEGEVPSYAAEFPYLMPYTVRSGDTLLGIAQQFGSTVEVINTASGLQAGATLVVGQQLSVPVQAPQSGYPAQLIVSSVEGAATCVTATPTPIVAAVAPVAASGPFIAQDVALAAFGVNNIELGSPRGAALFRFDVPADWLLDGTNVLYLNAEYFENIPAGVAVDSNLVSTLNVYMDDELISSVTLTRNNIGTQTLIIPLPANLLTIGETAHSLQLILQAQDHCLLNAISRLFIRTDLSYFHFEYHRYFPQLDLGRYPAPFYNGAIGEVAESVVMVLPDEPSDAELQAASGIAAGVGQLTFNSLQLNVVRASELTDTLRRDNNLLLIGKIGAHAEIDALYEAGAMLTTLQNGAVSYAGRPVEATDGIVQLIANPDNEMRAIGVVTGLNDEALLKAAQAISGPPSLLGLGGPLALISETRSVGQIQAGTRLETRVTFRDLGVEQLLLTGIGMQTAEVKFTAPAGAQLAPDAALDLIFNYSAALGDGSTISVLMNDTPIASAFLGASGIASEALEIDAQGRYHLRARIPAESVAAGEQNSVTIMLDVETEEECVFPDPLVTWFNVSPDSELFLPREYTAAETTTPLLSWFPVPFNVLPNLQDVLVSLPDNASSEEIQQALQILSRLGSDTVGGLAFKPLVNVGPLPEGVDLAQYHLIVLGRPSTNPLLNDLNANLPQPFVPGTDEIQQTLDDVSYRLPAGFDIGVLQALRSPWSPDRSVVVITGTGPAGQAEAVRVLALNLYGRSGLKGNVAYATANSISVVDTNQIYYAEDMLTEIPAMQTQSAQQAVVEAANPVFTVTPGPTYTPTPTRTPTPLLTATPIFPTATQPTPLATFTPLPQELMQTTTVAQPPWMNILIIATVIVLLTTIIFALLVGARSRRNNNR